MAEGDIILLETIKKLFPETENEFKSLSEFSVDFTLEISAKLINIIYDKSVIQNVKAPQSMSARYKMGSKLAECCHDLGLESCGYQSFLYSNESDLRLILMFLLDKLPQVQEDSSIEQQKLGKIEKIRQDIKNQESENVETEVDTFDAWAVTGLTDEELFKLLPKETRAAALDAKIKLNSLIQQNEEWKQEKQESSSTTFQEKIQIQEQDKVKKEVEEAVEEVNVQAENAPKVPSQDDKLKALSKKKAKLEADLIQVQKKHQEAVQEIKEKKKEKQELDCKFDEILKEKEEKDKKLEKRLQIMTLIKDDSGQGNLEKLKELIHKKKLKMKNFQEQFQLHQESLIQEKERMKQEIQQLKATINIKSNRKNLTVQEQILEIKKKIEQQKKYGLSLMSKCQALPSEYVPRSAFTGQIMDILNRVSKQKAETDKVIQDIKTVQKDINNLEGKLSRTYADVDYRLFEQAKQDKILVPAYRLLLEIHKANDGIIETIRKTGQVKRSIRTLQESVSVEKDKKIGAKSKKLEADLKQIQAENQALAKMRK